MRDPKKELTESGYKDYLCTLRCLGRDLFDLTNQGDDLLIDPEFMATLYSAREVLERLEAINDAGDYEDEE